MEDRSKGSFHFEETQAIRVKGKLTDVRPALFKSDKAQRSTRLVMLSQDLSLSENPDTAQAAMHRTKEAARFVK